MLDAVSLLCVLLLVGVLGFLLGTGRFSRRLAAPPLSSVSSLASTSPHASIGFQPSLSLQPLQRSAAASTSSPSEPSALSASPSLSAGQPVAAAAVAHAGDGSAASSFPSSTSSAASLTSARHLIVVAKHLPIKVNVGVAGGGSDEWTVEWEDSRSFLSNLRLLSSPQLSIQWVGLAQQSFLDGSVSAAQQSRYVELCGSHGCHPVLLPARLHDDFINGFCKNILWPMLHYVMPDATQCFGAGWQAVWEAYAEANSLIAAAVLRLLRSPHDCVWIHNYHLFLVPSVLRRASPYAKIGLFIHTPFPTSDIFRCLPSRSALLESIMCCDLLGFHTFDYARHFLSCSKRVLDLDFETLPGGALGIKYSGRFVSLLISHVGIASDVIRRVSQSEAVLQRVKDIRQQMAGRRLLMGVEDLDAVKGPLLKLQAIDRFLSKYGDQVGKVCFVELLLLSRNSSDTLGIQRDMLAGIGRLQARYGKEVVHVLQPHDWMPLEEVLAWYRASHVAVCSTFWDGLNLMPYEYTASQDAASPGALILSEFTGCSRSLNGVLRVNPWSLEAVADAIQQSLSMTPEERRANHSRRFTYVVNHTVERWASGFLEHLDRASALGAALHFVVQGSGPGSRLLGLPSDFHRLDEAAVLRAYRRCGKRILFLDYDGTLIPSDQRKGPSKGVSGHPPASLLRLLSRLCEDEDSCVFLMSGRTRASLMDWFGGLQQLGLAAEKGLFLRWPRRLEKSCRMTWGESSRLTEDDDDDDDAAAADAQYRTAVTAAGGMSASPPQPPVVRSLSLQMSTTSPSSSPRSPAASALQADSWEHMVSLHDVSWKAAALAIIRSYTEQTDGSWIEDKEFAIVWHYEQADEEYGRMQATDLHKYLTKALSNPAVDIVKYEYSSCLEVKPHGVSKGNAATAICEALLNDREKERSLLYAAQDAAAASLNLRLSGGFHRAMTAPPAVVSLPELSRALPPPPFRQSGAEESRVMFLAVGDDRSDEDMFVAVQGRHWKDEKLRVGRLKEQAGMRRGATAAAMEEKEQQHRRQGHADAQQQQPAVSPQRAAQPGSDSDADNVFTVCVGLKPSAAHYYLEDDRAVVRMLHGLAGSGRRDSAERRPASAAPLRAEHSAASAAQQDSGDGLRHRKKASRELQPDSR